MKIFHPMTCRCACGKMHVSDIAGEWFDRVCLDDIDCPDCQEQKIQQERERYGITETKRANAIQVESSDG